MAVGVLVQMSGWIGGPLKTVIQVAREGLFPQAWGFQKQNDVGISRNALFFQAIMVSIFALFFILPNVNGIFLVVSGITMLIYCVIYTLIALAFIRLRYKSPNQERPFMVGRKNNVLAWIVTVAFITTLVAAVVVTLYPQPWAFRIIFIVVLVVLVLVPLWIYSIRSSDWLSRIRRLQFRKKVPAVPLTVNNPGLFGNLDEKEKKWWEFWKKQ